MNIDGVEILKKTELMTTQAKAGWWIPFVVGVAVTTALLVIAAIIIKRTNFVSLTKKATLLCASGLCIIAAFFSLCWGTHRAVLQAYDLIPSGKYEYEVFVDETANFREVHNAYEVVDSKGAIWILRDK